LGEELAAEVLQGKVELERGAAALARQRLEAVTTRWPQSVWAWEVLSHVLLREGKDMATAERVLRHILTLDPGHGQARHNLALLLRDRGETVDVPGSQPSVSLEGLYRQACVTPSDINEHLPLLHERARQCRHVTEFGMRTGVSTVALLFAQPEKLISYDLRRYPQVDLLTSLAGRTEFVFCQDDVLRVEIEETDLLFIDTLHTFDQVREELRRHGHKARQYVVLHDTTTFGEEGEVPGSHGIWAAVEEFLTRGNFIIKERFVNNNGLTVLERVAGQGDGGVKPGQDQPR
jgi:hypothetical protein